MQANFVNRYYGKAQEIFPIMKGNSPVNIQASSQQLSSSMETTPVTPTSPLQGLLLSPQVSPTTFLPLPPLTTPNISYLPSECHTLSNNSPSPPIEISSMFRSSSSEAGVFLSLSSGCGVSPNVNDPSYPCPPQPEIHNLPDPKKKSWKFFFTLRQCFSFISKFNCFDCKQKDL